MLALPVDCGSSTPYSSMPPSAARNVVIALTDRCRCGLSQGHVVLQQMGGKQQFDVAGRDRFSRLDHAQGFDQLCIRADGKAQAEAWQTKFLEKLSM